MMGRLLSGTVGAARSRLAGPSDIDRYWNEWVVRSEPFSSAQESEAYLEWRFGKYPFFRDLTGLWGDHAGETILDYGCGPGHDLVGLLLNARPNKVIGLDVSRKALALAKHRLRLHEIPSSSYELRRIADKDPVLPVDSASIDFVNCQGVLHHVSDPLRTLRELRRVLKDSGRGVVMVYNRESLYFHLYAAYVRMIVQGRFVGLSVDAAFTGSTDGPDCPVARAYSTTDFVELCRRAGFDGTFAGAYFAEEELDWLRDHLEDALAEPHLAEEHRDFLHALERDESGYPLYRGHRAGVGAVYHLLPA